MKNLRVVFMGTPEFSVGILKSIQNSQHELVGIVTVADKPAGRGQQLSESAVKKFAVQENIPVLQPLKLKDEVFINKLAGFEADVFVVVAFRMLPDIVWKMPKKGTFNLHASLLPDYRGAAPINWTLINGDSVSGLSTFFIDEEIDTGKVIFQEELQLSKNETAGELHDRMIVIGGDLVVKTLDGIVKKSISPIPQIEFTSTLNRPAPKLFKENTRITWNNDIVQIHNLIRGLSPYPCAWTIWENEKQGVKNVKIFLSMVSEETGEFGLWSNKKQVFFTNESGTIELLQFQIEGKKRLSAQEWLVGNKISDWKVN